MKKVLSWAFAAALICGLNVFTSCSNDDNPVKPTDNLAEKIIGKWMISERDNHIALTNEKEVITFVSPTKAYVSKSLYGRKESIQDPIPTEMPDPIPSIPGWNNYEEFDVTIEGNTVILTSDGPNGSKSSTKYQIKSISENEFACVVIFPTPGDGMVPPSGFNDKQNQKYKRVSRDYSEDILGLWECKGLKGGETYNDANGRLEFFEDGTYQYWRKNDAGEWEAVTTREFQDYFVDGTLLATRWKNEGEDELREWWEIKSLKGDKMQWKALRANDDGSTFEQIMDWEKIEED